MMRGELKCYKTSMAVFKSSEAITFTPMLQQYLSIKAAHQDCLLAFRLGDFYELFFEDAREAAPILDIVLTRRGRQGDEEIPMCGVPYHSADLYWAKLIKAGHKLAICEQLETPQEAKKRGTKAVVRREVVRIMTPGTLVEETLLESKVSQHLVSIYVSDDIAYMGCADITTGKVLVEKAGLLATGNMLAKFDPDEILISDKTFAIPVLKPFLQQYKDKITFRPERSFRKESSDEIVCKFYGIASKAGIAKLSEEEWVCIGALLEYIGYTHKDIKPLIGKPRSMLSSYYMDIDAATRRSLELSSAFGRHSSLIGILDNTMTAMGGRLFGHHAAFVLSDVSAINRRLESVEFFVKNSELMLKLRVMLKELPDFQRIMTKLCAGKGFFSDFINIRNGLKMVLMIAELVGSHTGSQIPDGIRIAISQIGNFSDVLDKLSRALIDGIGAESARYINIGFSHKLAALYRLRDDSDSAIENLRNEYRGLTGISNLKISYNNMLGYYIEVGSGHLGKLKEEHGFILRQSMVNVSRFKTEALGELEVKIASCAQEIEEEERAIFRDILESVVGVADAITASAEAMAWIDVASSNAFVAIKYGYSKPIITDGLEFEIEGGRHPIVERYCAGKFVANACHITEAERILLITGPNMAGKSTFLRQNALIIIMAQMGMFVPAKSAQIGIVDKLFSRIGASDDIASGQSTFMVEMVETAYILNNATKRSFLILDEVGRGTSTQDGLAIAWSILENLHDTLKARTMFATHYHELADLSDTLNSLACYTMKIAEWNGELVLLHEVMPGRADKSYGIHVAKLAGVPEEIIERAEEILLSIKQNEKAQITSGMK